MAVDSHDHVECWRFGYALYLNHLHRSGRHARSFQKPAQLRDLLWRQCFGMKLVKYVTLLTDLQMNSAVRFLPRRTEPLGEVQSVRPGDIARNRMPENRLEGTPIPIWNPMKCRQLALPVFASSAVPPRLRVIHTTIKRQAVARARQDSLSVLGIGARGVRLRPRGKPRYTRWVPECGTVGASGICKTGRDPCFSL
jgi:hypothetical protein